MARMIGWLDMNRTANGDGRVAIKVQQEGNVIRLVRSLGSTIMWRQVDSENPQDWIGEAARVWQELQVEGSIFRSAESKEWDS